MSHFTFSQAVTTQLERAGWRTDRAVDVLHLSKIIAHDLFPLANEILSSFYKLVVDPGHSDVRMFSPESIAFSPEDAIEGQEDRYKSWERDLNLQIYPLGVYGSEMSIFTTSSGLLYLSYGYSLWAVADSFSEGIEILLTASSVPQWVTPS